MSLHGIAQGFGRPAPAVLGGAADDLVQEIQSSDAWRNLTADAANKIYDQVHSRFEADMPQLSNEIISTASPGLKQLASETVSVIEPKAKQAMLDIFDDAETQARLGKTQSEIRNSFIQVVAVGALATAVGTWLLVRYAGQRR